MLNSMTGFGESTLEKDGLTVNVEIRTVNNRHLKLSCRLPDGYASLEPKIDAVVRRQVRRGSVLLTLQISRHVSSDDFQINEEVLQNYVQQLSKFRDRVLPGSDEIRIESLLELPGVVDEKRSRTSIIESEWPLIEETLCQAIENLAEMRAEEGKAMAIDLQANRTAIIGELDLITKRAPQVVQAYEKRLRERLSQLLAEFDVQSQPQDVVREVGVYAERADISEEIVRLQSHLEQFDSIVSSEESTGRKLEFLIQEMFRETNTIGSKANDSEIARHVVEIKTVIERLREMVQNVE